MEAREVVEEFGTPDSQPDFWKNLSAQSFIDRISVPLLYFQGTADTSVVKSWTDASVEMLRAANQEVEYIVYSDQPHEFTSQRGDFMRRSAEFFREHLR